MPAPVSSSIWDRLLAGEHIPMDDPDYGEIRRAVEHTLALSVRLNNSSDLAEIRHLLGLIVGEPVEESTTVFPPFHTNVGRHLRLGHRVFINHGCSFLDLGGITLEDDVMVGPQVCITSENHPVEPERRNTLVPGRVLIRRGAWIGAKATILPGVTVGEHSVVAAGAVVHRDVPDRCVVAGVPARVIKQL